VEGFQCVDKLTDVAEDCDEGHLLDVGAFARHVWSEKKNIHAKDQPPLSIL
jgi:hypothetical protein